VNIRPGRVVLLANTHDTKDPDGAEPVRSVAYLRYVAQMYMNLAR
jgi:hypothetical protein